MSCWLAHIASSQQPGEHVCWIAVAAFSLRVAHAFFCLAYLVLYEKFLRGFTNASVVLRISCYRSM